MRIRNALVLTIALATVPAFAQTTVGRFEVRALSARPEMVTGGDVLIEIARPSSTSEIAIAVNGRDASVELGPTTSASPLIARVAKLQPGRNVIEVGEKGRQPSARLTVVNHPITGPVMSGPRQTPFTCETQVFGFGPPLDADCSVATRVDYFYRSQQTEGNPFKPYDEKAPRPADLATTTTLDGKTVPYIVRREMGTIDRAVYVIAFLHEPGTPLPDPWHPSTSLGTGPSTSLGTGPSTSLGTGPSTPLGAGPSTPLGAGTRGATWNGRLVYSFGAGCQAGYHQGRNIGGLLNNRHFLEESQLGDYAIAKGYAVASSSLNAFGTTCADVISAETMMMVKEHFIEQFGVPRYTIGSGRSGGSMQQHLIANNYPGLLDGLIPTAAFADTLVFLNHMTDCELLEHAFETSTLAWSDEQKAAVAGEANWEFCARNGTSFAILRPGYCDRTGVAADLVYDPKTKRDGVRCTYQDNLVNVFGRDPATGFARRPLDNVGVQYGLTALNAGRITFEHFIDLNTRIGGHDIDGRVVQARTVADPEALRIAFQTGRVNATGDGMATIPIIDVRPYTDGTGDVHDIVNSHITRARLVAANGTSGNQVLHTYAPGIFMDRVQPANLDEMDQWLAAIANDTRPAKSPLEKVIRNRPIVVTDACYTRDGQRITDMARCAGMFPVYSNPRLNAGQPMSSTLLKCELKTPDARDYKMRLTNDQIAALRTAFPSGVCDYSKKGVAVRAPDTWLSYGSDQVGSPPRRP
jgi:hypothetical protein